MAKSKRELVDELWALKKQIRDLEKENDRHESDISRSKHIIANGGYFEPLDKAGIAREQKNITDRTGKIKNNKTELGKLKRRHDSLWKTIKNM